MGRLKYGSKFECPEIIGLIIFDGYGLRNEENGKQLYVDRYVLKMEFTLIEENTIDEIEELDLEEHTFGDIKDKINELVIAVNKLKKEIQELKEK